MQCKRCSSRKSYWVPQSSGFHAYRVECEGGHFIKWGSEEQCQADLAAGAGTIGKRPPAHLTDVDITSIFK